MTARIKLPQPNVNQTSGLNFVVEFDGVSYRVFRQSEWNKDFGTPESKEPLELTLEADAVRSLIRESDVRVLGLRLLWSEKTLLAFVTLKSQ